MDRIFELESLRKAIGTVRLLSEELQETFTGASIGSENSLPDLHWALQLDWTHTGPPTGPLLHGYGEVDWASTGPLADLYGDFYWYPIVPP